MFCKNIASLAVAMETCDPWILAKRAIFLQNILWESCSKFYLKCFCYNTFYLKIISLAIIMIIRFQVNLIKKPVRGGVCKNKARLGHTMRLYYSIICGGGILGTLRLELPIQLLKYPKEREEEDEEEGEKEKNRVREL